MTHAIAPGLALFCSLAAGQPVAAPRPTEVAGIVPGTTRRAEVELLLGEPLAAGDGAAGVAYAAPAALAGARRVRVGYFADDRRVSEVEVELVTPFDPLAMAERLGRLVHREARGDGRLVEYFFPSLLALVHTGTSPGTPAAAVVYLSPRRMADLFCDRAEAAAGRRDWDEAENDADKAVVVAPEYARGYRCRARALAGSGNADAALAQLLAATQAPIGRLERTLAACDVARAYHARGWKDRAWKALEDARRADPTGPQPWVAEADLRAADGDGDRSIRALASAVELAPGDDALRLRLADALHAARRDAEAGPHYARLADSDVGDRFTIAARAGLGLARAGRHAEALAHYQRAAALRPDDLWVNNNFADCLLHLERPAEALPLLEAAVRKAPDELIPARNLGLALLALGRAEEAVRKLEALARRHPGDVWLMVHVARALAARDRRGQALDWLERAVAAGFRDVEFLRRDPYLETVRDRSRSRFERLISRG